MPTPSLVSSLAAVVALELPKVPPLSQDAGVILVADFIRVGMLILGLSIAAVSVRHLKITRRYTSNPFIEGFRWRVAALLVAIVYVVVSAYDRLGEPVTLQFVLALVFLLVALRSVHIAAYLPPEPVAGEDRLRDLRTEPQRADGWPAGWPPDRPPTS